jgi:hypothetical protein
MSSHLAVTSDVVADSAPSRILKLHQGHGSRCSEPDTFTARDKIKEVMPKRKSFEGACFVDYPFSGRARTKMAEFQ